MAINTNGQVASGTRQNLIRGLRSRAMPGPAVEVAFQQSIKFVEGLVDTYSTVIAKNEVGEHGSGIASETDILGDKPATALLYGRVQSGKTAAMLLSSALAMDNGFRVVIVLTTNNTALVQQTANRFKDLNGPLVFSTNKDGDSYEWVGQEEYLREDIGNDGLVLVSAKNYIHLPHVQGFMQEIEAFGYPTIIFDDEADAATPDTTLAARSMGRSNAPDYASTTHRQVILNDMPGQAGESLREMLPHSLYVQVTATPFILYLQDNASRIRPDFSYLLEPGEGYCGGQEFFGHFNPTSKESPQAPLVFVPSNEGQALNRRKIPDGLASSVNFFLIAAIAKSMIDEKWPRKGFKHLSHPSRLINQQTFVANHIERHLRSLRRELRTAPTQLVTHLQESYDELRRTQNTLPALNDIIELLPEVIRQAEVKSVNSQNGSPNFGPHVNFLIGGDILGRGITVDDLLVTYYVREAQISQMDTIWQHARMYGYRMELMPYTRVFLPRKVAISFKGIYESEEELRDLLRREAAGEEVPVRIALGTRATRPNALDPSALRVIKGGRDQLYPLHLETAQDDSAREILNIMNNLNIPLDESQQGERAKKISVKSMKQLTDMIPVKDGDLGSWNSAIISAVFEEYEDQYNDGAIIYVRALTHNQSPPEGWGTGRLSGDEVNLIRTTADGSPALALMYAGSSDNPTAWYPTLVMPRNSSSYIINAA